MGQILSQVDGKLVACVFRRAHAGAAREGPDDPDQLLQVSRKSLASGRAFPAHVHMATKRHTVGTQEAWIVVEGVAHVSLLDIDDSPLDVVKLGPGDCFVTYRGGHSLTIVQDAVIYEVKNGPYFGQAIDKRQVP